VNMIHIRVSLMMFKINGVASSGDNIEFQLQDEISVEVIDLVGTQN
jgi:hypothetical protein